MDTNRELLAFIAASPTAFHAVRNMAEKLLDEGYEELKEYEPWDVREGGKYFVRRNGSSLIALRIPPQTPVGLMIAAAHSDSPALKLKESAAIDDGRYVRLGVEKYGGMLLAPWLDRPLSVAGRVTVKENGRIVSKLVDLKKPVALIPNVAIHMDRTANDGKKLDPAVDMPALFSLSGSADFPALIAGAVGVKEEDILSKDLFLYPLCEGTVWGADGEFVSSPRLDDLQCAFGCLHGFLEAGESKSLGVFCVFDNEEVGSGTKQGADSDLLTAVLRRACACLGLSEDAFLALAANGFMVSADNAHAVHPNHPELADKNDRPVPNGGVVIKYNANSRYTTDSVSAAVFGEICREADVSVQRFTNRADMPGGSTLGNISLAHLSLDCVDIGLAQLAMHSCYETAGAKDTDSLIAAMRAFFSRTLRRTQDGLSIEA